MSSDFFCRLKTGAGRSRLPLVGLAIFLAGATAVSSAMAASANIIYRFAGGTDGSGPVGRVVSGGTDILYGTTQQGGANGQGTVFSLIRTAGVWKHKVLYSFKGGSDGAFPQ